jgi:hypothetical protein
MGVNREFIDKEIRCSSVLPVLPVVPPGDHHNQEEHCGQPPRRA